MPFTLASLLSNFTGNTTNQSLPSVGTLAEDLITEPSCEEKPDGSCDPKCYGMTTVADKGHCRYKDSDGSLKTPPWIRYKCTDPQTCKATASKHCCSDSRCMGFSYNSNNDNLRVACKSKTTTDGVCKRGGSTSIDGLSWVTGGGGTSTDLTCLNSGNGKTNQQCYTMYNCENTSTSTSESAPYMKTNNKFNTEEGITLNSSDGNTVTLTPGKYDSGNMGMTDPSSIYIPSGFKVYLYGNAGFTGHIGTYTGQRTVNLSSQVSSLKVGSTRRCNTDNLYSRVCGCQNCVNSLGNPVCDAETCKQYCLDDPKCTHAFLNLNGGCQLYSSCDTSSYAGTSGEIYEKTTDTTTTTDTPRNTANCECTDDCLASSEGYYMSTDCDTECYGFKELDGDGKCTKSSLGKAGMSTTKYTCAADLSCIPNATTACAADSRCKAFASDSENKDVTFYCGSLTNEDGPCANAGTYSIPNLSIKENPKSETNTNASSCFDTVTNSIEDQYNKCYTKNDCITQYSPKRPDLSCNDGCITKDEVGFVNCSNDDALPLCSACENDSDPKYYCSGGGGYCSTQGEEGSGSYHCKETGTKCAPDFQLPTQTAQSCDLDMEGSYSTVASESCDTQSLKFSINSDQKYEDCANSSDGEINYKIRDYSLPSCKIAARKEPDAKGFSFGTIDGVPNTCVLRNTVDCAKTGSTDSAFFVKPIIETMQNMTPKTGCSTIALMILAVLLILLIYKFLMK